MQSLPELFRGHRRESQPQSIFDEFNQLQKRMDRWMRQFPESMSELESPWFTQKLEPSFDVEDRDSHYVLSFDMPGVKKEDIRMTLDNGLLTVSAERSDQSERKRRGQYRSQQSYLSYERSFSLPPEVKPEQIESEYRNGVLRIAVPKTKALQSKSIPIGEGKSGILSQAAPVSGQKQLN